MSGYKKKAKQFLEQIGATVSIRFKERGPVDGWGDHAEHNTYSVLVRRNGKGWTYDFHDSIHNTERGLTPTAYDVLSCVEQYDPGTIDDFVREFGYEVHCWDDVRRIERIYAAVKEEAANFQRLFGDVADEFAEVFA